jgi:NADH:ubiquinone oxidoreductase subunit K
MDIEKWNELLRRKTIVWNAEQNESNTVQSIVAPLNHLLNSFLVFMQAFVIFLLEFLEKTNTIDSIVIAIFYLTLWFEQITIGLSVLSNQERIVTISTNVFRTIDDVRNNVIENEKVKNKFNELVEKELDAV